LRRRSLLFRVGKKSDTQDNDDDDAQNSCGTVVLRCCRWPGLLLGKRPDWSFVAQLFKTISSRPFNMFFLQGDHIEKQQTRENQHLYQKEFIISVLFNNNNV